MRKIFWIALLVAALTNLGCIVPSLHPLFTEEDLVLEPRMVGAWNDEGGALWVFARASENSYRLTLEDSQELSRFDAHLLRLDKHLFLDLFPRTQGLEDTFRGMHLLPVHTFYKVSLKASSLKLTALDQDWLEEMKEKDSLGLAHVETENGLLLTASTPELQEFVREFANDPAAFPKDDASDWVSLLRPATP